MTTFLIILNLFGFAYLLGGHLYLQERQRRIELTAALLIKSLQHNTPVLISTLQSHQAALRFLGKALGKELALQEIEKFSQNLPTEQKH